MSELGFEIDGQTYEVPMPSTLDLDEARIFHREAGFVVEDIWLNDMEFSDLVRREGFLTALVCIAYRRGNPGLEDTEIRRLVGKQNRLKLFGSMLASLIPEDDSSPKDEGTTSVPSESSKSSNGEKQSTPPNEPSSSGMTSEKSSDRPEGVLATIGTTGSGTQSTSALPKQAA